MNFLIFTFVILFSNHTFATNIKFDTLIRNLSSKKLIAIGESGHAVADFHNIRSKISQDLISKHKFRNIILEVDLLTGFKINNAIQDCAKKRTNIDTLKEAFLLFDIQTYRHNEFFPFFQFVCEWNKNNPQDTLHLLGMDAWSPTWEIRKYLETHLANTSLNQSQLLSAKNNCFLWSIDHLKDYKTHVDWTYYEKHKQIEPHRNRLCLSNLVKIQKELKNLKLSRDNFIKLSMAIDTGIANQEIRDIFEFNFAQAMTIRDKLQASNTLKLIHLINNKAGTIYLAHNLHVFTKISKTVSQEQNDQYPWNNVVSSGEILKKKFKQSMSVVGLGGYNIKSLRDGQYPIPNQNNSIDYILHKQNKKFSIINSHHYPWAYKYWRVHNETAKMGLYIKPREQFDYYIFLDSAEAATRFKVSTF